MLKCDGVRAFESYPSMSIGAGSGTYTEYMRSSGRATAFILLGTFPRHWTQNSPSGEGFRFSETRRGCTLPCSSNAPSSYIDAAERQEPCVFVTKRDEPLGRDPGYGRGVVRLYSVNDARQDEKPIRDR